ncbi:MAG: zinc ABC transporter substrate-binding protein [Tepidisphaeraceae bacterium]
MPANALHNSRHDSGEAVSILTIAVALLAGLPLIGLLAGCEDSASPPAEKITVVASAYALAEIAMQVGGERVSAEWLIESGQPIDELEETPERRQKLRSANLIVTRGQVDPWTLAGHTNEYTERRIIRIDKLPAAAEADNTHYLWVDPRVAIDLADELAMRLGTIEPRSETYFKANAADFSRQVANLMEQTSTKINEHGGGLFAALDRHFLPLARRFGLQEVALPPVSLSDPTAFGVKSIRQATKEAGAAAMFGNSEMPIALRREWELRLSMPVLALEAVGSTATRGRDTYLAMLRHNLDQLVQGVEASAAPTPIPLPVYSLPGLQIPTTSPEDEARAETDKIFNSRPIFTIPRPTTKPATTSPFKPIPLDLRRLLDGRGNQRLNH